MVRNKKMGDDLFCGWHAVTFFFFFLFSCPVAFLPFFIYFFH